MKKQLTTTLLPAFLDCNSYFFTAPELGSDSEAGSSSSFSSGSSSSSSGTSTTKKEVGPKDGPWKKKYCGNIGVYPNHNRLKFKLEIQVTEVQDMDVTITNVVGQQVLFEKLTQIEETWHKEIDLKGYSPWVTLYIDSAFIPIFALAAPNLNGISHIDRAA